MKVRFTRQAFAEREAIFNYLEERAPQGALSVISRIHAGISRLADFPKAVTRPTSLAFASSS
ncbi:MULTISPECIES: type II toxin-antitoxin system RelE/ParE family toxin [unclassified Mesorhizobium]|uniref:type II toxin-antitoxin system RelE/ParE family toxin n=1 Tax=unclassified Mesorhizobium TaxID=325217 RepID=UPI003334EFEF